MRSVGIEGGGIEGGGIGSGVEFETRVEGVGRGTETVAFEAASSPPASSRLSSSPFARGVGAPCDSEPMEPGA